MIAEDECPRSVCTVPGGSAHRVKQTRVRVPYPVPAHYRQSQLFASRLELSIDEIVPVQGCPRIRSKHQSIGHQPQQHAADMENET